MLRLLGRPTNNQGIEKDKFPLRAHLTRIDNEMLPMSVGLRMCLHIWLEILKLFARTPNGNSFFNKDIDISYYILFLMEGCSFDCRAVPDHYAYITENLDVGENAAVIFMNILNQNPSVTSELVMDPEVIILAMSSLAFDGVDARHIFRIICIVNILI
jgi:hypothetical protein